MTSRASLRRKMRRVDEVLEGIYGEHERGEAMDPLDSLILTMLSQSTSDHNRDMAWRALKERYPEWTLVGSGDVLSPVEGARMLLETGVDAVAVGRGALGNPAYFAQAAAIALGAPPPPFPPRDQARWLRQYPQYRVRLNQ